jgi:hypothetical protein
MEVDKNSWHYRAYQGWWKRKLRYESAIHKHAPWKVPQERKQLDLCHYMRVVLIFGPFRWFFQGDLGGPPPFVWTLFGGIVLAFVGVLGVAVYRQPLHSAEVAGLLIVVALAAFGLVYGGLKLYERHEAKLSAQRELYFEGKLPPKAAGMTGRKGLLWTWILAKKRRICPLIKVQE